MMTNVVQFPRHSPPPPTVDALLNELTTVEIELARARLAQVRSETRQNNALWVSYCLKRVLFWGCLLWLLATCSHAQAQNQTIFRDSRGSSHAHGQYDRVS
jgi:hypothetical protein